MPELLIELFSEEIPARMQARAAGDLGSGLASRLKAAGLNFGEIHPFATPRRLAIWVGHMADRSPDVAEQRKGPRVGAPAKAIEGFLRGAGLDSIDDAEIVADPKKGDFYVANITKPGRSADDIIAEALTDIVETFPWPKSMRWGSGSLRWVRPLHSILAILNEEDGSTRAVSFEVGGITSGNTTEGHRFHARERFEVASFADYDAKLKAAKVILDPAKRRASIKDQCDKLAAEASLSVVDDPGLLDEVAGLVEWPVVMLGGFDAEFLEIPDAVIRATIRANQKCFVLSDPKTGKLANKFLLTSNIEAVDGGKAIVAGNERVIRARLSDALYFWRTDQAPLPDLDTLAQSAEKLKLDLSKPLDQRMARLDALGVVFHAKLGTQGERVQRIANLARLLSEVTGADPDLAERAAKLAKADLQTEAVGEFPELQGFMGARYAELQGEDASVVATIEDHYKPQGPSDSVPTDAVAVTVALADKLDTLCGFWAIDEKPTGSKDPYALRRAALGIIRLARASGYPFYPIGQIEGYFRRNLPGVAEKDISPIKHSFQFFIEERLSVSLREEGISYDVVNAALAGSRDRIINDVILSAQALSNLLKSEDGENLLAGYRRAANILAAEEKKGTAVSVAVDQALFDQNEETELSQALNAATVSARAAITRGDFEAAMTALASLRAPIDAFFEAVLVNAEDEAVRANRLALLEAVRSAVNEVADLSMIEG